MRDEIYKKTLNEQKLKLTTLTISEIGKKSISTTALTRTRITSKILCCGIIEFMYLQEEIPL